MCGTRGGGGGGGGGGGISELRAAFIQQSVVDLGPGHQLTPNYFETVFHIMYKRLMTAV